MSADLVVGEVGFGPQFDDDSVNLRLKITALEAEVSELIRQRNRLRRVLQDCAALSPQVSDRKHEILLETAPKVA